MKDLYIGIDASNYTSSMAVFDDNQNIVFEKRIPLEVKKGNRGLRQSDAVFMHIKNFSIILEEFKKYKGNNNILAICASTKPRPLKDSYMPVFIVSQTLGQAFSLGSSACFYETSHQEGHIMAGVWSSNIPMNDHFLAFHLSGGTTEIILTHWEGDGFKESIVGGSQDLNVGQFIDRIGVAMDLEFPCGPALEKLALNGRKGKMIIPSSVKGTYASFSGPETKGQRLIKRGENRADVAFAVQHCIAKSIEKVIIKSVGITGVKNILMVGGVSSNHYLREFLMDKFQHTNIRLYFCSNRYSSDNSVGVALLAKEKHKRYRRENGGQ